MPEGPEIRLAADRVAGAIVGEPLETVYFAFPHLQDFAPRLEGETVIEVATRGKAMLTRFSNGLTMYSHNQLYGRWYTTKGDLPKTGRSLRVALKTGRKSAFLYSASDVDILDDEELKTHPFLARLGPDILDATPAEVRAVLSSKRCSGRALGGLYLDQSVLAGVGNYLRSEILFFAGCHHSQKPRDLPAKTLAKLARTTTRIATRSYKTRGITNPPSRVARLKKAGATRGRLRFAVFGRAGRDCYVCGQRIVKTSVGSRRLYYCPGCQPG